MRTSFGLSLILTLGGPAWGSIGIVKKEPVAASGRCLPQIDREDVRSVMNRLEIQTRGARPDELIAMARGLKQIETLAGGDFDQAHGAVFVFNNGPRISRQTANGIMMGRGGRSEINSIAYYVHELGHYVGNRNHAELYGDYKRSVPQCRVSRYATVVWNSWTARNEEFAEVFAAYVTNPQLLLKGGENCVRAYQFFKTQVFESATTLQCNFPVASIREKPKTPTPVAKPAGPAIAKPATAPQPTPGATAAAPSKPASSTPPTAASPTTAAVPPKPSTTPATPQQVPAPAPAPTEPPKSTEITTASLIQADMEEPEADCSGRFETTP